MKCRPFNNAKGYIIANFTTVPSGLARARAAGRRFGRPPALSAEQRQMARERLNAGASISAVARELETSRQTIMRLRDAAVSLTEPKQP